MCKLIKLRVFLCPLEFTTNSIVVANDMLVSTRLQSNNNVVRGIALRNIAS